MRALALLSLFALAACSDPTAPAAEPIPSRWSLNAWAGDDYGHGCRLSGDVGVEGTPDAFAGKANLVVTITDNGTTVDMGMVGVSVRGAPDAVTVGGYQLAVRSRERRLFVGTWECDGTPGVWFMGPPVQSKH